MKSPVDMKRRTFARNFENPAGGSLPEGLRRAERIISDRAGIINRVWFEELDAGQPAVYWAHSQPADLVPLFGQPGMNFGSGVSMDPDRALMKAIGESVERYCSAQYDKSQLPLSSFEMLAENAVSPEAFALYSQRQYDEPGFPFARMDLKTPLRWVPGHSLVTEKETLVPAAFVYVPYQFDPPNEPAVNNPISTGQACGPDLNGAIYKSILEVIERDAFMITWQNRIIPPYLDLSTVENSFVQGFLGEMKGLPFRITALNLTLDIKVPVFLVLITSESGHRPYTTAGLGADLNPERALVLALEEAFLTFLGMGGETPANSNDFQPTPGFGNVDNLDLHGIAHATLPELQQSVEFLLKSNVELTLSEMADASRESMAENICYLVDQISGRGFDVIYVDLTTLDVDEAGFKVARVVIPGFQPLDISHQHRYLGGGRLFNVPVEMGLRSEAVNAEGLNPFPHPFP